MPTDDTLLETAVVLLFLGATASFAFILIHRLFRERALQGWSHPEMVSLDSEMVIAENGPRIPG
jgi:hypothetical protein